MAERWDRYGTTVLAGISVLLALAASLTKIFDNDKTSLNLVVGLFGGATTTLSFSILSHFTQIRGHLKTLEPYVMEIEPLENRRERLRRAFREAYLKAVPTSIDLSWWQSFAYAVLSNDDLVKSLKPSDVSKFVTMEDIIVPESLTYSLMRSLVDIVMSKHQSYSGTATDKEFINAKGETAEHFLYQYPLEHPKSIRRLICATDTRRFIKRLDAKLRLCLRGQIEAGVELRIWRFTDELPPNFGLYGNVALGRLETDGTNRVIFNANAIAAQQSDFEGYWQRSHRLSLDDFNA